MKWLLLCFIAFVAQGCATVNRDGKEYYALFVPTSGVSPTAVVGTVLHVACYATDCMSGNEEPKSKQVQKVINADEEPGWESDYFCSE